jgi:Protein of unknown function (DUF3822)
MSTIKPHTTLFDKSFSDTKTGEYDIYIQLSKNGLKYTLLDIDKKTFIAFESYQFNEIYNDFSLVTPLQELIKNIPLFKKTFNSFNVAYVNNRSTLIPNAIYKADELKTYHQYNFTKQEEDQFFSDQLINLSAHNVYSIPDFIINEFKSFNKVNFKHFSSSLIEASLLNAKTNNILSSIDLHILPDSFQIIVIKNQQLELYNSFEYQTSEDFIYYLLFVLEQLKINNEEASIRCLGEVEKKSAIYSILYKYIKTITFSEGPENLKFSYILENVPPHFHHALFNQFL